MKNNKEQTCNNLDVSPEIYTEWKKPIPKGCTLCDFTSYSWNDKIIEIEEQMSSCQGLEGEGIGRKWLELLKGNVRGTRGNGNILYLHYIKISISRVLPYSFGRCYGWGKLLKDTYCLFVLWLILACDPTILSKSTNFLRASKEKKKSSSTFIGASY